MAELQDIDGLGPAREDSLNEAGYETVADVAAVEDHEQLAEEIGVPADTALEFVVQAQDTVESSTDDSDDSDEEEVEAETLSEEILEEVSEEVEESSEDDSQEESEDDVEEEDVAESYEVTLHLDGERAFDVLFDAVIEGYKESYNSNAYREEALDHVLDKLRHVSTGGEVELLLTEAELNHLHSAVVQRRTRYQGENLIHLMDELNAVLEELNEQREEYLF